MKFGDFGIGHTISLTAAMNLNDLTVSGHYFNPAGANAAGNNYPASIAGSLHHITDSSTGRASQTFITYGTAVSYIRAKGGGGEWSAWRLQRDSGNTTVDSNGFLKAASPIMRLGGLADPEHGFTLAGAGAVNAEAAAVNATHKATGRYHIHGSLGLAQSGWQIEIPRDHNGNRLVHVSTQWEGGVLAMTVAVPVWADGLWIAGAPMDIPEGRWVDIRLHENPAEAA